jgi:hypothetical protein
MIHEPPYQIIELIGIQGWWLIWRNVRLIARTRVHRCILVFRLKMAVETWISGSQLSKARKGGCLEADLGCWQW